MLWSAILAILKKHWKPIVIVFLVIGLVVGGKIAKDRYDEARWQEGWDAHVAVIEQQRVNAERQAREVITEKGKQFDEIRKELRAKGGSDCGVLVDLAIDRMPERKN